MSILLNKYSRLLFVLTCLSMISCDKESEALLVEELDEEYQLYDYYIDENGNEGIVAYILKESSISKYPKGYKYRIVISSDESLEPWGPMGEIVMKKDSASSSEFRQPTAGITMLQSMNSRGMERYPAQNWCFKKNNSNEISASSWHLPSYYELQQIFGSSGKNLSALNHALQVTGGKQIDNSQLYWTCMEDYDGYISVSDLKLDYDQANRAILTSPHISTYANKDRWLKKNKYYVRAIKYIYYYNH